MLNVYNIKQIFHAFLFNITNYSLEICNIYIHLHEAELNIILPRMNFNIKQKNALNIYCLFHYIPKSLKHKFLVNL